MKKIYSILFATAVAALAMVSCQKSIQEENVMENETPESSIHFYAEDISTKTVFGTPAGNNYPTLWTDTYKMKISQNLGSKDNKLSPVAAEVVPSVDGKTASFTYTSSNITDDGSASYIFYAVSPSVAFTSLSKATVTDKHWAVTVASSQTPTATSVDEKVQLIVAESTEFDTFPSSVSFAFSHITAYGKLTLVNFNPDDGETVSSISLTSPKNWAGNYSWYPVAMSEHAAGEWVEYGSLSKTITINTSATEDVWFACVPVDLGGQVVNVEITTNKGVYSKNITIPAGKKFEAGKIASFGINMSGITRTEPDAYNIAGIKALYTDAQKAFTAKLTDALVTIVNGDNAYIQDASGAVLIYSPGHGLYVGDKLTGIISGSIKDYNGLKEIVSFSNSAVKTSGNTVTPATVALSTLVENFDDYESQYVKVENLTVSAVSGKDITISEDANLKIRNESGKTIAVGTKINAVGAPGKYNTTKQVKIYSLNDDDVLLIPAVINASNKNVTVGSTISIGATTNSTADITYESTNTSIATVDEEGVITGVATGSTTITCTVAASGKYTATSKQITVTVTAASSVPSPETITFSELGLENGTKYSEPFDGGHFTITFGGGGNDGKYYTTGSGIRTYGGGTITITSEYDIEEVAFTWDGSNAPASDVADPTGYSTETKKWTGSSKSIVLTRPSGSGHWRLQSVKVTYSE